MNQFLNFIKNQKGDWGPQMVSAWVLLWGSLAESVGVGFSQC